MKKYERDWMKGVIVVLTVLFLLVSCDSPFGSNDGGDSKDRDEPTSDEPADEAITADEAISELETLLSDIDMSSYDPSQGPEGLISTDELSGMEDSFESVLEADSTDPIGNLGMAMTTFAGIAYRDSVAAAMNFYSDSGGSEGDISTAGVNTQIAVAPSMLETLSETPTIPESWDTMGEIQEELAEVLQVLDGAVNYMDTAVENIGTDTIEVTVSEDTVVLDKADLLLFRIPMQNLQIALATSLIYDLRLFDADGEFTVTDSTTDQELQEALIYSLDNDTDFLTARADSPTLRDVRQGINGILADAVNAYDLIMARTGDQTQYLIPNDDLEIPEEFYTNLEQELTGLGVGLEPDLSSLKDIQDLAEDILDGDQTLTSEINATPYTVNLGNFFESTDGLRDWLHNEYLIALIKEETPPDLQFPDSTFDGTITDGNGGGLSEDDFEALLMMMGS